MNRNISRALALILALAMTLALAGCGNEAEKQAEAEPQYVYRSEFTTLPDLHSGALTVLTYTEDGAYAYCNEKVGREIPETVDAEGMTQDQLSKYDIYSNVLYFIGNDGTVTKLPNYSPIPGKENEDEHADFYSQPGINAMTVDDEGNLLLLEYLYTGWFDGPEGMTYVDEDYYSHYKTSQDVYIRTLDTTGAELSCARMELEPEQYFNSIVTTDANGNILCGVDTQLLAFDREGRQVYSVECGGYITTVLKLEDGSIYTALWGDTGLELISVNCETQTLGRSVSLPSDAYMPIAGGGDYDLYYTSGLNFYGYDTETETAEPLFNWINCDVNSDGVSGVHIDENGTVTGFISETDYGDGNYSNGEITVSVDTQGENYVNQKLTISKQPYDPATQQETLTLACLSLDYSVRDAVIRYNRRSEGARIEIKDYSEYNTGDDSSAGTQKLLTEIMAGDVADILAMSGLPYRRIASKGLLEDLYPYLDADKDVQRDDILPNIMDALEVNGELYSVCPSFSIITVMGAKSIVGDGTGWTYDEFEAALAKMPEGCEPFESGVSRDDILRVCVSLDMARYIDWASKECSFDSDEFMELLEFASLFPETHTDDIEEDPQERLRSGQQMLVVTSLYSLDSTLYEQSYFDGAEVNYIGFPTLSGSGNVLNTECSFAMSSSCKDKEAAWQFLRGFLTESYQKENVWSIPTNLGAYADKLAEVMTVTYMEDENGQYKLDENGDKIKEPRYTMSSGNGPVVNIYAMSQEQADTVSKVINSTTKAYDFDESIVSIVLTEAKAYFAGQKSAEEVAKLIQGKISIYVSEQS